MRQVLAWTEDNQSNEWKFTVNGCQVKSMPSNKSDEMLNEGMGYGIPHSGLVTGLLTLDNLT